MYINWDLWAIATMLLAIYWFDRKAEVASAVALGIAVVNKVLANISADSNCNYFL
jgi:hypothetical protein